MKLVVFGLTISSSWGNGHATLWRGLARALASRGHRLVFFEHDAPYYAAHRDLAAIPGGDLVLYSEWDEVRARARAELADADAAMVTSFCPHGIEATALVLDAPRAVRAFYDLDTPVTLAALGEGRGTTYVGEGGFSGFDLVLSYTGGGALDALRDRLGARRVAPLYGHVDPETHRPGAAPDPAYAADLSYLGTYAADRQAALEALFVEPARRAPHRRFLIAGAQYPAGFPWGAIRFVHHLPPGEHPAFYASSRLTLNVTRGVMAAMGWCPSGRLFEAAACGAPILSDWFEGLDAFLEPGTEVLVARSTEEALAAVELSDAELTRVAAAARARVLADHTSARRIETLECELEAARQPAPAEAASLGAAA